MYFLKKSSIEDFLEKPISEDVFYSGINVLEHYKDYEIFLKAENMNNSAKELQKKLETYKASVKAVHCPASMFLTSSDKSTNCSTNYLSLDEVLSDEKSFEILKNTIFFAKEFSSEKDPVIVILHAGSINGCGRTKLPKHNDSALNEMIDKLAELKIDKKVKIAIENVTPYIDYNNTTIKIGMNTGWGKSYLDYIDNTLKKLNNQKSNISFGVCIDFCHLIADFNITKEKCLGKKKCLLKENCCDYIAAFMKEFEQKIGKENIMLFHVSMFGEDGSHGNLFQSGKDDELLETIRSVCAKYPDVPITLEMADGTDIDKACVNFDRMMYAFSNMHRNGLFSDMLNDELKEFFENLFRVYAVPWTNMSRIQTHLSKVKSYVMENTPTNATGGMASVFGFTHDEDVINTALVRLKVYILYTRFCNLGKYLAEVYSKANYLSDKKEDFNRSMKYFMFCDYEIHQCVYTGVGYTFNMDFLPKRIEKVYRFYDRIDNVKSFKPDEQLERNYFAQMVEAIRNQINGKLSMFSLGKNFFPCFMKYYQEPVGNNFTLRIYENMAVNYVETNEKIYMSLPAFLHKYCYMKEEKVSELDFVIDISIFRKGRGGANNSDVGTLAGFIKKIGINNSEISYEKVGSITDGEIVATKLPIQDSNNEYTFKTDVALGLVHIFKKYGDKKCPKCSKITITKENGAESSLNNIEIKIIFELKNKVKISENERNKNDYESYCGNNLQELYNKYTIKIEEVDEDV